MTTKVCPTEDEECKAFSAWLKYRGVPHTHIPNENAGGYTPADRRRMMLRMKKLKAMGLSAGYWDYDIYIPVKDLDGIISTYELVKIEMKRFKGGTVSQQQKDWQKIYEATGIPCKICKGFDDAKQFVEACMARINCEQ